MGPMLPPGRVITTCAISVLKYGNANIGNANIFNWVCDYLFILWFKSIHVCKMGSRFIPANSPHYCNGLYQLQSGVHGTSKDAYKQQLCCNKQPRNFHTFTWCHDMETLFFPLSALLTLCERTPLVISGFPSLKIGYTEHWHFLCCQNKNAVKQTVKLSVILDPMMLMWSHCNALSLLSWMIITA